MLVFYCKLILIEMSHSSMSQKTIIQKKGVDHLLTLEEFSAPHGTCKENFRKYFKTLKERF